MDERTRRCEQWEAWANELEPDMTEWEQAYAAWHAHYADGEPPDRPVEQHAPKEVTMKRACWKALAEPLPWWLSPGGIAGGLLSNLRDRGITPATVRGGLLGGMIVLLLFCSLRRLLVGHWR